MIYIATVHWNTEKWIDIQLNYLKKYLSHDFKIYAFLNGINKKHYKKFNWVSDDNIKNHSLKLDILAEEITKVANPDDIILFLDGDAFPINEISDFIKRQLDIYKLIAIKRIENLGDKQPHPSFCATTIKFWNDINGTWSRKIPWKDENKKLVYDIGGTLLNILKENNIEWLPLLRSNKKNYHPLRFGIYENLIYHHGAGFRNTFTRLDYKYYNKTLYNIIESTPNFNVLKKFKAFALKTFIEKKHLNKVIKLDNQIRCAINNNTDFFNTLTNNE